MTKLVFEPSIPVSVSHALGHFVMQQLIEQQFIKLTVHQILSNLVWAF